ncbi:ATP-binding protein [Leucobacter luti]|uniref:ATP-binding protein n=1 Tax=Leucobacter luti TaxID=340320 RepID=UPI003CFDD2CA
MKDQPRPSGAQSDPPPGQWRLSEVQVANWGTFDGAIYRMPISREGHLITGPSGSGKSSLLDAISAVLTPDQWLRFNTAAQGSQARDDRRTLMSYVRGAWSRATDELEDRVVSQLLRPRATWSGIILRYENGAEQPVSLCRLFFARGTTTQPADLASISLIERSDIDLRDLEPFAHRGLEARKIQSQWPDALVTSAGSHRKFYSRMRKLFGISNESALQLLHKTQSAKSLDSLDQLFRDYMLEQPRTFEIADNAAQQFGELNDAHEHVVELRMQRDHLNAFRTQSEDYDSAEAQARKAHELAEAVLPYQRTRRLELAQGELLHNEERAADLAAQVETAHLLADRAQETLDVARQRELRLGGGDVEQLRHRISTAQAEAERTSQRWEALAKNLRDVGISHTPASAAEYVELLAQFDHSAAFTSPTGPTHDDHQRLAEARHKVSRIENEIKTLRISGSSVPGALLQIRDEIAEAVGAPPQAFPFAAELLEVKKEHVNWTGAIERVLRPLALTLLVPSHHLSEVRRWVNTHRINGRLTYEVVGEAAAPRPAASAVSLLSRVSVATHPHGAWLTGILSQRYDYACVDHPDELDQHARAITVEGQIKQSATRYEKDDRRQVDDQRHWVLGDREAKHEALLAHLRSAEAERKAAQSVVDRATAVQHQALNRNAVIGTLRDQSWAHFDRERARGDVSALEQHLDALTRTDSDLNAAIKQTSHASTALQQARSDLDSLRVDHGEIIRSQEKLKSEVADLKAQLGSPEGPVLLADLADELDRRFHAMQRRITRQNIGDIGHQVSNALRREKDEASDFSNRAGSALIQLATQFKERWPAAAAELSPTIAGRVGYLEVLDGITTHRLPEHEARFLRLLRERSRDMVGDLVSEILAAPEEIRERISPVNTSLRRSPFDRGRFLNLRVKTRRSSVVNDFLADLRSVSDSSWGDNSADTAEARFSTLAQIMRRFESSDRLDRAWKRQCLDTRLHVIFLADEIDKEDRVCATYDSAASLSGGQQQKLVVFCLAAALRYQLTDTEEQHSRYGTVILDEAFDKADAPFTRMALDVFTEFGFHLVLATPHKLLQTLEPYIGGATEVENPTHRKSQISQVMWERGNP